MLGEKSSCLWQIGQFCGRFGLCTQRALCPLLVSTRSGTMITRYLISKRPDNVLVEVKKLDLLPWCVSTENHIILDDEFVKF